MRNRGSLLLLVAVFLGLAIITLLQSRSLSPEAATATAAPTGTFERVFPDMAVLDIQAIRLEDPATRATFTISRAQNGLWSAPGSQRTLDADVATAIARTVVLLPYEISLPLTEDSDLSTYGFRPNPRLYIQVLLHNGTTHIVAVGALTPSQASYYAVVDERSALYLLEAHAVAFLMTTLASPPLT